jgi:hypothetical protein
MDDRTYLSDILNVKLTIRHPVDGASEVESDAYRHGYVVICKGKEVVAAVDPEDLYDRYYNRFKAG